jgi:hypothetical protein
MCNEGPVEGSVDGLASRPGGDVVRDLGVAKFLPRLC